MNTQTIVRNSIDYSSYKRMYGFMINTKILDFVVALDFVDGIRVDRNEVLKLHREIGDSLNYHSSYTKLFNFVIKKLNDAYPDLEPFNSLNFNYKVVQNFVLGEMEFRQFITQKQRVDIMNYILEYDFLSNYTWLCKLCTAISYYSDDALMYFGLGLSENELKDIIQTMDDSITFENRKELDQTLLWHVIRILDVNGGYR